MDANIKRKTLFKIYFIRIFNMFNHLFLLGFFVKVNMLCRNAMDGKKGETRKRKYAKIYNLMIEFVGGLVHNW